jgi:hypothetical protein
MVFSGVVRSRKAACRTGKRGENSRTTGEEMLPAIAEVVKKSCRSALSQKIFAWGMSGLTLIPRIQVQDRRKNIPARHFKRR